MPLERSKFIMNGISKGRKIKPRSKIQKEAVQVFCRVRPSVNPSEHVWLRVVPPCHVLLTSSSALRNGSDIRFTFNNVFNESTGQKTLFDSIALPLVENVLIGRNELLFAYGITGSGKTYTMTGTPQDVGVIPRSLDVIFNSISNYQANKYIFKPDRSNGFNIQSEHDAAMDRNRENLRNMSNKNAKNEKKVNTARIRESTVVSVDEDNLYSVFITYIEIYNNTVYDLLEDIDDKLLHVKSQTPKTIREDANHNMFVYGVNEVEARSADEAFELYLKGKKRRTIWQTNLNSESSRSHSIFNIRIVQAPLNANGSEVCKDKSALIVSQLSLVDLAGSERANRTKNSGQRLREACNINTSLLTLRLCLELLRENQNGAKKIIPYRDSRLTHLFKTFLDGDGQISIIICINPHNIDDYEETLHVMKFAKMSKDVQVNVSTPIKTNLFMEGRGKAYQMAKEAEKIALKQDVENYAPSWLGNLPDARSLDDDNLPDLIKCLEDGLIAVSNIRKEVVDSCAEGKKRLLHVQREIGSSMEELGVLRNQFLQEKEKVIILEKKEKKAQKAFAQKMMMAQEKLNRNFEKKIRNKNPAFQYGIRSNLNSVKMNVANDDMLDPSGTFLKPLAPSFSQESLCGSSQQSPRSRKIPITHSTPCSPRGRPTARKIELAISRCRRSRSVEDDVWLEPDV